MMSHNFRRLLQKQWSHLWAQCDGVMIVLHVVCADELGVRKEYVGGLDRVDGMCRVCMGALTQVDRVCVGALTRVDMVCLGALTQVGIGCVWVH